MTVRFNRDRGKWVYDFTRGGQRYAGYCVDSATLKDAANKTQANAIELALKVEIDRAAREKELAKLKESRPGFALATAIAEHMGRAEEAGRNLTNKLTYGAAAL